MSIRLQKLTGPTEVARGHYASTLVSSGNALRQHSLVFAAGVSPRYASRAAFTIHIGE